MVLRSRAHLPIPILLLLTACGGGTASVATAPETTVTPVPSPTPTPTPTPTTTPAATYAPAFDFTRDRSFTELVTASTTQTIPARLTYDSASTGTIAYTAATQALSAFGTSIVPNTMGATLIRTDSRLAYTYSFGTSPASLTVNRASADATYVGYVRDDKSVKPLPYSTFALIGAPTLATDVPRAGPTTYRLTVAEIGTAPTGQTLVIDQSGRRITGTVLLTLAGSSAAISAVFQGTVDSDTGRFDGTVTTADGTYTGAFHGRLYGPTGVEIGLIFDLADRSGNDSPGIIVGKAA